MPMRRALAVVLATAVACPPFVVATATSALASVAEEKKLGAEFVDEAVAHMPLIHDYELAGYLRDMGNKLVVALGTTPFEYEFFVVRDDDINAFSVPGGKLFANAGLISRVDSDDALAGVIGHEVAHAAAHHLVRQQEKGAAASYASLLGLLLGIVNPGLAIASLAAGQAAQLKYQRDFEREADYLGIGYAKKAGYDPAAMMGLLHKINDDQSLNPTRIPPYFLSHPLSGERLTNLEAVLGRHEWDPSKSVPSLRLKRAQAIARAYSQSRDQCVPEYERALAAAKPADRPEALELLGILMSHGEEYVTADKYLREAEAAGRNVDRELGRTAFRRGNFPEARTRLNRVLVKTPADWDTLADLAAMDTQEGNYAAAAEKLERSVAGEAYRADVLLALGRALGKSSREGEGFYWVGRASEVQGNPRQAVEYFKRSLAALPKNDPNMDKIRQDMIKRSERLGEEIHDKSVEAQKQGQRTAPDGTPIGPAPQPH
ncbi:MAG TPA: M48 family metalloprotease [Candidatus Limnocylindrales bacterium]|nr:M48 family metalloprotease [Candidatus Limnocylindrales bacterium]